MKNNNVVCLVLNYNDPSTTQEMVEAIKLYKTFNYILIIDNHSTDNSFEYLTKAFETDKHVIVKRTQKNGGYGYGNNFGVRYAKKQLNAKYVLLSNPDVRFSEKMVESLLKLMKSKNAAIVSGRQKMNSKFIDNPGWKIPSAFQWTLIETRFHDYAASKYYYPKKYFDVDYTKVDCVRGANFLLDTDKFLEVDGYDERMFLYGEETLLGYKLKKAGYSSYILSSQYYNHEVSSSISKSIPSVIRQIEITHDSKLVFYKYYLKINFISFNLYKNLFKLMISRKKKKLRI